MTTIAGRYDLLDRMGDIYAAQDRLTGQPVALKQLLIHPTQYPALATRWRTVAALPHPQMIRLLDYGVDGTAFITMPLLDRPQTILQVGRTLDLHGRIQLLIHTLQAIMALHRRGIAHGNLKPSKVLVVDDRVMLMPDVRTAHLPADDLFAFGALAYELLTGCAPFAQQQEPDFSLLLNLISFPAIPIKQSDEYDAHPPTLMLDAAPINPSQPTLMLSEDQMLGIDRKVLQAAAQMTTTIQRLTEVLQKLLVQPPRYTSAIQVLLDLSAIFDEKLPDEATLLRGNGLSIPPFIGRQAELGQLNAAFDRVLAGQGSILLVRGDSGVGKSRLVDELRLHALINGALILQGTTLWGDPIRRLRLTSELSGQESALLKRRTDTIVISQMLAQQTQPVVVILDQLTPETHASLITLAQQIAHLPVLILATTDAALTIPGAQVIQLAPFTPEEVSTLSAAMSVSCDPQQVKQLYAQTGGNAVFVIEALRMLAEKNEMPGSIAEMVKRRLARVPLADYPLLRVAAILGHEIDLHALSFFKPNLDNWLHRGVEAGILMVHGERWHFSHEQIRAGLVAAMRDDERPQVYRQAAEALEHVYPNSPDHNALAALCWQLAGSRVQQYR